MCAAVAVTVIFLAGCNNTVMDSSSTLSDQTESRAVSADAAAEVEMPASEIRVWEEPLPESFENPVQEAIYTYDWHMNLDEELEEYFWRHDHLPAYYNVWLMDADLDGQTEILLFGSKSYTYEYRNDICQILKIKDDGIGVLNTIEVSRTVGNLFFESGEREYFEATDGRYVTYAWIQTHQGNYAFPELYSLLEISLEDWSTKPILVHTSSKEPVPADADASLRDGNKYYSFDSQNYSYAIGSMRFNNDFGPEGYTEITAEDYEKQLAAYLDSLTYCGTMTPSHVVEFPSNISLWNNGDFENNGFSAYAPPQDASDEEYFICGNNFKLAVAERIYQAFVLYDPPRFDAEDEILHDGEQ